MKPQPKPKPASEVLQKLHASVQDYHDRLLSSQRYGHSLENGTCVNSQNTGCYGGAGLNFIEYSTSKRAQYFWTCFHGDGLAYDRSDLTDPAVKQKTMLSYKRPWNKFEGTDRSKLWVNFLMSNSSPWKALHPFIIEQDRDFINSAGFIFSDLENVPTKLWYNFLMAIRFPWEIPENYSVFLELQKIRPENPALALYISCNFMLKRGAASWDGPWEIVYPWSFLEGLSVEKVKRFVTCDPATVASMSTNTPNVYALWGTQGPSDMSLMFEDLSSKGTLTLDRIYSELKGVL